MKVENNDYTTQIKYIAGVLDLGRTIKSNENLQMLCPFHIETNASFGINRKTGSYNCFCCSASGHINNLSNHLKGNIIAKEVKEILKYKVKTLIDPIGFKEKPTKDNLKAITNRTELPNFKNYSIYDILYHIVKGHTIIPSGKRNAKQWEEQQLIMLDFDNDQKEKCYTMEEVLDFAKQINLSPTFAYRTFSSMKKIKEDLEPRERFRFAYCLEKTIRDKKQFENILYNLINRFKKYGVDLKCMDFARKFSGTNNEDVYTSNYVYSISDRYTEEQLHDVNLLLQNEEQSKIKKINYSSVNDLLQKELPPLNVIVEDFLKQGLTILAGSPKVGKSWGCLNLCIAICQNKSIFGFQTNKCECLYLALEDGDRRIKDRVNKILNGEQLPNGFYYSIECSTLDNGLLEELENFMTEKPNTKLIIIDTLQKIRGSRKSNESDYSYDYREMGKLKKFADKHKISVLVIHHLRKTKDGDVFNEISGSTGLTGSADATIVLSKKENTNEVILAITGRDVESKEKTIKFNTETFKWEVLYDVEEKTEEMLYNGNPVVITIKKMLTINPNGYKTSSSDLIETIKKMTGTYPKQDTPQALTRYINETLRFQLLKFDGIYYNPPNENGGKNGRKLFFSKPIIEEIEEQQEENDLETEENQ